MRAFISSLRFRLTILVLLAMLPALGLILHGGLEERQQAAAAAQTEALRLARLAAHSQANLVESARQLLVAVAQLPAVRSQDSRACNAFLAALLPQYPHYANLGAIQTNGDVFCSAVPLEGPLNLADRSYFQQAVQTRTFTVGDYQISRVLQTPVVVFAYPVLDDAGQVRWVATVALDLRWMNGFAAEAELPPGATLTLIDRGGTILARSAEADAWVGKTMSDEPLVQAVLAKQGEGASQSTGVDGVGRLYAYVPLTADSGGAAAYVLVGIPTEIAMTQADRALLRNLTALGLVAVLALGIVWIAGGAAVVRPIRRLLESTQRLNAGGLDARTGLPDGPGEVNRLGYAFDRMAESLHQREAERRQAEEALRRSEALYHDLVENSQDLIFQCDAEGRYTYLNPAWEAVFGYPPDEMLGRQFTDFQSAECAARDRQEFARLIQGHVVKGYKTVHLGKDGREIYLVFDARLLRDAKGVVVGIRGTAYDVSDRERAEQALRSANRALRMLSQCNQTLARITDEWTLPQEICRLIVEEGGYRLAWVGFAEQDEAKAVRPVAQAGFEDGYLETLNITWADTERGRGPTGTAIRTGRPYMARDIPGDANFAPWRSDAIRRGYASSIALPLIAEGQALGALNIYSGEPDAFDAEEVKLLSELAADLAYGIQGLRARAEQQRAEAAIRRQSRDLATLLEVSQALAATLDLDTVLQVSVDSAVDLMELGSAAIYLLEGETLHLRATRPPLPPHFPEEFRRAPLADHPHVRQAISTGRPVILGDTTAASLTPAERAVSEMRSLRTVLYVPLVGAGESTGVFIVGSVGKPRAFSEAEIDLSRTLSTLAALAVENARLYLQVNEHAATLERRVTERTAELEVARDQALAADRVKSAFLATMSHELRTPLNSIIGFSGILLQGLAGPLSAEQSRQLGMVYGSAHHLLELINDVLDISKIEAGEVAIACELFDLPEVIHHAVGSVTVQAQQKGLTLKVALSSDLGRIISDRRRVEQILINLLNNAVKFTSQGQVRVEGLAHNDTIEIRVVDTGEGIRPEDLSQLFQPFRQLDVGLSRRHEGTGLGLAISRRLARMLGGEVTVESEWGRGSVFTLRLPH